MFQSRSIILLNHDGAASTANEKNAIPGHPKISLKISVGIHAPVQTMRSTRLSL